MKFLFAACVCLLGALFVAGCSRDNQSVPEPQSSLPAQSASEPAEKNVEITKVKLDSPAFGGVDGINEVVSPKAGSTIKISGAQIKIAGVYVDAVRGEAASGVVVMVGEKPYVATYGGARPDIAAALNNPRYLNSQFYVEVPTSSVGAGLHELKVRVIAADRSGYYESGLISVLDVK